MDWSEARLPTLLLVEDDPAVRESLTLFLSGQYEIHAAADSASALARVYTRQAQGLPAYDLLLIDLRLGLGADGIECLRMLRQCEGYDDPDLVPAIAFSGLVTPVIKRRCAMAGFAVTLAKPFMADVVEGNIEALLAENWSERNLRRALPAEPERYSGFGLMR